LHLGHYTRSNKNYNAENKRVCRAEHIKNNWKRPCPDRPTDGTILLPDGKNKGTERKIEGKDKGRLKNGP
jgi:hypothetical protein